MGGRVGSFPDFLRTINKQHATRVIIYCNTRLLAFFSGNLFFSTQLGKRHVRVCVSRPGLSFSILGRCFLRCHPDGRDFKYREIGRKTVCVCVVKMTNEQNKERSLKGRCIFTIIDQLKRVFFSFL